MDVLKPPQALQFTENISEKWKLWKQKFNNFMIATEMDKKPEETKVAAFLTIIGTEGLEIYNLLDFATEADRQKYDVVLQRFEQYCTPRRNVVYERYKFFTRSQQEQETIDQYLTALKTLAVNCEFLETEAMLRDRIVLGTKYTGMQEKMIREPELKLSRAMEMCKIHEVSKTQIKEIQNTTVEVNKISRAASAERPARKQRSETNANTRTKQEVRDCQSCGYTHEYRNCPAFGRKCIKCQKQNHFAKMCRSRPTRTNMITQTLENEDPEQEMIWQISADKGNKDWYTKLKIKGKNISLRVDTGSHVNIVHSKTLKLIGKKVKVEKKGAKLVSYTGHSIEVEGVVKLECEWEKKREELSFYVVTEPGYQSLIGLSAARKLGIIQSEISKSEKIQTIKAESPESILEKYKIVFEGRGKLKRKYKIRLKEGYKPETCPPRKIPLSIQSEVKNEIDNMVKSGVLVPVVEPTEWVSPIVIRKKPDKTIRVCMDPRSLNKYVIRETCWLPTTETIFAELGNAKIFTVLDASKAFHQVQLDEESSRLCTITTPYGRFRYTRLPYGLSSAPEVFQQAIGEVLEGLQGTAAYMDDIIIYGVNEEEHNIRLQKALQRIEASGLKLAKEKTQLAVKEIEYLGHRISNKGIRIDPSKTEAVINMKPPKNKAELQSFLGLITYIAKYIPTLSEKTAPLRQLLSSTSLWNWEENGPEERAFKELKTLVTEAPVLSHYNINEEILLSVDASRYGLGAVMIQKGNPVAYASASLTKAQMNYSQVEKELLAIVYACEHFHYYTYGRKVLVETDHKPLLAIVKKPIDTLTARLQRLVMRLMRYTVALTHVPGKAIQAADALSRNPSGKLVDTSYMQVGEIRQESKLRTTPGRMETLRMETQKDEELTKVMDYCREGWPKRAREVPQNIRTYWNRQEELHVEGDVLYKGNILCIPRSLRAELLNVVHNMHQGTGACRRRAREAIYWPGMSSDIQQMVEACTVCRTYAKANNKETITPHPIPTLPWEKLGMDFKEEGELKLLVMVDYFSKFTVINRIPDKTADTVITALKNVFATHGLPKELYSDNGPPFDSKKYREFLKRYDISQNTSSPRFPESNGMVERTNQTVKAMIKKACIDRDDLMLAVLNHNTTPKEATASPAEILMGRKLRTMIPVSNKQLEPRFGIEVHRKALESNAEKMKERRRPRNLHSLVQGQAVYHQTDHRNWKPAVVLREREHNSYDIQTEGGRILRRNRRHLKQKSDGKTMELSMDREEEEERETQRKTNSGEEEGNDGEGKLTAGAECKVQETDVEKELTTQEERKPPVVTRSGRAVKPPVKLNL